ncbi:MAG: PilW family protein [Hydrogenophaga sp.]|nr:PilW family protein [Hydrogenophaga sp.]
MMHARKPLRTRPLPRSERGFSLIELLVAMTVGLILVAGLVTLFANSSQTGNELEKSIRQLESGRYGLELLTEDLSVAGYYGEVSMEGAALKPAAPCGTGSASLGWKNPTLAPVTPFEAPFPVTGVAKAETTGLECLTNRKTGTPALVVRRLDTDRVSPGVATNDRFHVQTSRCVSDPPDIRFVLSTNAADFNLKDQNCTGINLVQRYISRIYFVATCNECGVDTIPTLKRAELFTSSFVVSPLAEGVDDIAFEYGFDTDGNGGPDVYRLGLSGTAGAADNDWSNVVGVRVHLLSRSSEPTPGFQDGKTYSLGLAGTVGPVNDNFKRRVYTATTRLNNIAGPREAP